jgi:SPP1 gp7 family putative phage head morphogenesis protein
VYPLGIALEFERYIVAEAVTPTIDAVERFVIPALPEQRTDAVEDKQWYGQLHLAFQRALEASAVAPEVIAPFVAAFGARVNHFNQQQWHAILRQAYGVDVFVTEPAMLVELQTFELESIRLIKSLSPEYLANLQGKVVSAVRQGTSLRDMTKMVRETYKVPRNKAELIARDQIGKLNGALTEGRQTAAGVTDYRWRGVLDQRERDAHTDREGKVYSWNNPPDGGNPGAPIRCFPGSVQVDFPNDCTNLWRHSFTGRLVSIETSDGRFLEATPNHPILTKRGWLALDAIQEGDDVIHAVSDSAAVTENDVTDDVSTFEEIFNFVALTGTVTATALTEFDFHGEIPQNDVDAVAIAGHLLSDRCAAFSKRCGKFSLADSDVDLSVAGFDVPASGQGSFESDSLPVMPECCIGFGGHRFAALIVKLRNAYEHGLRLRSGGDVMVRKDATDYKSVDAVISSQLQDATPFSVGSYEGWLVEIGNTVVCWSSALASGGIDAFDAQVLAEVVGIAPEMDAYFFEGAPFTYEPLRVVNKSAREFSGHVFNASTGSGWYLANGIVAHNCRCWAEPVLPDFDDLNALFVH